jgi:hypothetical protein
VKQKVPYRFTREVRDSLHNMLVAVAGAGAAWVLTKVDTEPLALLAAVLVLTLTVAVAALVVKAMQRPSEDPGKNNPDLSDGSQHREQERPVPKTPRRSRAP